MTELLGLLGRKTHPGSGSHCADLAGKANCLRRLALKRPCSVLEEAKTYGSRQPGYNASGHRSAHYGWHGPCPFFQAGGWSYDRRSEINIRCTLALYQSPSVGGECGT